MRASHRGLRGSGEFSDVTLVSKDGAQVRAHRLILAASSPHLASLLSTLPSSAPLPLPSLSSSQLATVLDFIYHGEVEVEQTDLYTVLEIGETLQLKGLTKPQAKDREKVQVKKEEHSIESFSCSFCGKESKSSNDLGQHIVEHHSGVKKEDVDDSNELSVIDNRIEKLTQKLEEYKDVETDQEVSDSTENNEVLNPVEDWSLDDHDLESDTDEVDEKSSNETSNDDLSLKEKTEDLIEKVGDVWRCIECNRVAESSIARSKLKLHVQVHMDGVSFACKFCDHKANTAKSLSNHKYKQHRELMRSEEVQKDFECQVCGQKSISKKGLEGHMYKRHRDVSLKKDSSEEVIKDFECQVCGMRSISKHGLEGHMYKKHKGVSMKRNNEEKNFECKVCGRRSISQKGLEGHMYKNHKGLAKKEGKFKCKRCGKGSKTRKGREQHKWKYHRGQNENQTMVKNDERVAIAEEENLPLDDEKQTETDEENLTLDNDEPIEQNETNVTLDEEDYIQQDIDEDTEVLNEDLEGLDSSMDANESIAATNEEWREKVESLIEKDGDLWHCKVCGKLAEDSKARWTLKTHVETHLDLQHPCKFCDKTCSTTKILSNHMYKRHRDLMATLPQDSKDFECAICGVGATSEKALEQHKYKRHREIKAEVQPKEFTCGVCGKGSTTRKALEAHVYKRHKGFRSDGSAVVEVEKAFKCDICGTGSINKKALEGHKYKMHTRR